MAKQKFREGPNGPYPVPDSYGTKVFVAGVAIVAAVGGGTAAGIGGAASVGSGAAAALPGNLAGGVADSLPGRGLETRKAEGKKSAKRGRKDETFSRFKLIQLKQAAKHEIDCLLNSTGRVRDYLAEHRCASLDRNIFAVGDGHGNAAVISVARVGFPKKSDAEGCEKVEEVQGSGDIKPLGAALLGLDGVKFSGHHFQSRVDGRAMVIAETETVAGKVDSGTLDALADVAVWFPKL
ncbi:hypothetical protein [Amycolatopsis circi]|uniref:hypothetical protein n=1 Tax=Amycolatopsis circi TaxID=871959 RepID=UPI001FC9CA83|nr:hypothetical protein [Amycolatopsis circi]